MSSIDCNGEILIVIVLGIILAVMERFYNAAAKDNEDLNESLNHFVEASLFGGFAMLFWVASAYIWLIYSNLSVVTMVFMLLALIDFLFTAENVVQTFHTVSEIKAQ